MIARDERESSDNGFSEGDAAGASGSEQEVPVASVYAPARPHLLDASSAVTMGASQQQLQRNVQTGAGSAGLSSQLAPLCSQADLLLKGTSTDVLLLARLAYYERLDLSSRSHTEQTCTSKLYTSMYNIFFVLSFRTAKSCTLF